jgi:hypothetical protein
MRIAARGLYAHPDVLDLVVQGVRIYSYVEEVLHFVNRRGNALGLLDAELCGRCEAPWDREEPHMIELQQKLMSWTTWQGSLSSASWTRPEGTPPPTGTRC